jgi:3-hydroxy-D-aspartate aldolase
MDPQANNGSRWYEVENAGEVFSPALLVYPDRVEENLRRMLAIAGSPDRLRPHVKTNKMPAVLRMMLDLGIRKFKCATVAEAEMCAAGQAPDVLWAYQPVGPNVDRVLQLAKRFPQTRFSVVADDESALLGLSRAAQAVNLTLAVLLDIDCGQHRTGLEPGPAALDRYRQIHHFPGLTPGGLHVYDGHLGDSNPAERARQCEASFAPVQALWDQLRKEELPVPAVVAGGTPTFPMHARRPDVELSPGTCVFWDAGYAQKLPDLDFLHAALLLTRIISKPARDRLCLDLGHKAVAAEMPPPRVLFPELPDARPVLHSEEHLVVETSQADRFQVGDCLYGIPWHICPTVALHGEAVVIRNQRAEDRWKITARDRRLTV